MAEAPERLSRVLGLVPYASARPGVSLEALAEHFGVDVETITDDLQLIFVTGRPGHMPDDLIEAQWGPDGVYITNADEVSAPVRLSASEAASLVVALDYLQAANPDLDALPKLRDKIQSVGAEIPPIVDVPRVPDWLRRTLTGAEEADVPLVIDYYVPARDELTRRVIRPKGLRLAGRWYLDAYCETSGGDRTFRVDNIDAAAPAEGDIDSAPQPKAQDEPVDYRIELDSEAAWILDEYAFSDIVHDDEAAAASGTITVFSRDWLNRTLLSWGRWIRSIDPMPDVDDVTAQLHRIVEDSR